MLNVIRWGWISVDFFFFLRKYKCWIYEWNKKPTILLCILFQMIIRRESKITMLMGLDLVPFNKRIYWPHNSVSHRLITFTKCIQMSIFTQKCIQLEIFCLMIWKNMMSYFNMLKITPLNDLGVPDSKFQTNHPNSDRKITKF